MTQPESKPPRSNELEQVREFITARSWHDAKAEAWDGWSYADQEVAMMLIAFAAQVEERCCKDVCELCRLPEDWKPAFRLTSGEWVHEHIIQGGSGGGIDDCKAAAIRERSRQNV